MSKRKWFCMILVLSVSILCTGCARYTFFERIPFIKELFCEKPENVQEEIDMNLYDLPKHLKTSKRPDAFSEEVLNEILSLEISESERFVPEGDVYERKDTNAMEYPENVWEVLIADPDDHFAMAQVMLERYFASYRYEDTKTMDNPNILPEKDLGYVEVQWAGVVAGDRDKAAIATAVKLHNVQKENTIYTQFGELGDDGAIHCNLTILAEKISDYQYKLAGVVKTSDVSERMELPYELTYAEEFPVEETEIKVENETLFVTYDGGKEWAAVPVTMDELFSNTTYGEQALPSKGSYYVSKEKTIFVYGGTMEVPATTLISYDAGKTWEKNAISDWNGVRRCYTGESGDKKLLYTLLCGDKTMGSEWTQLYLSYDNGKTWKKMGSANGEGSFLVNGICFFDEEHGMTAITDHEALSFYQTSNGGKTWEHVSIESPEIGWTMVYEPQLQGEDYVFYVGQDGYEEMSGILYKYVSKDEGQTWEIEGKVIL